MAIVSSFGALQVYTANRSSFWKSGDVGGSVSLATGTASTYAHIYETQPNVRICVEFLARNIAQLGLHVFRRVSDTDRVRLFDHDVANWLSRPNPQMTRYRLFEATVQDFAIYANAFWLKVR